MDAAVKELKLLKQKSGEVQIEAKNARAAFLSAQPGVKKEEMRQQWLSLIEDREMIDSRTTLAIGIARAGMYSVLMAHRCIQNVGHAHIWQYSKATALHNPGKGN